MVDDTFGKNCRTVSIPGFFVVPSRIFQSVVNGTPDSVDSFCISACERPPSRARISAIGGNEVFIAEQPTAFGRLNQPDSVGIRHYRIRMDRNSKKVLWENVSTLMKRAYGKDNLGKLAKEAKFGPATSTRLKKQETSVGLDVIDRIAATFKVKPWHLLVPKLDMELWPFPSIDPEDYHRLDESERAFVEQTAAHAIKRQQTNKMVHTKPTHEIETDQLPLPSKKK